jgi:putative ATPase
METIESRPAEPVPFQLRNAPTGLMKKWGYGAGYQHAHKMDDALTDMECLPESLIGTRFYQPTRRGSEQRIAERLEEIRNHKKNKGEPPQ